MTHIISDIYIHVHRALIIIAWHYITLLRRIILSCQTFNHSGVDVNSEVPERSRKNFEMTFLVDFPKLSRLFFREILE